MAKRRSDKIPDKTYFVLLVFVKMVMLVIDFNDLFFACYSLTFLYVMYCSIWFKHFVCKIFLSLYFIGIPVIITYLCLYQVDNRRI